MATGVQRSVTRDDRTGGLPVTVRGLTRTFDDHNIIDNLELDIEPGQFVALLGASGCGKSTLLRILAGLDADISGDATVAAQRAVAFQAPRLMPWKKVWRNITLGLKGGTKHAALSALDEVGLSHRANVWPKVLSGGEAQRASLARALVRQPDLLLLDEPFSALDALTRLKMQDLVEQLWRKHECAILLVTHDVEEALILADRILVMKDGRIAHDLAIHTDRPRDITGPELASLRIRLLGWLGVHTAAIDAEGSGADEFGNRDAITKNQSGNKKQGVHS